VSIMARFVWTKVGAEAGQTIDAIAARKEAERIAGDGEFWWGVRNSLGTAVATAAAAHDSLPVIFSKMTSAARVIDTSPGEVWLWNTWIDATGHLHEVPSHVVVTSRGGERKKAHYALVCHSDTSLSLDGTLPFDPTACFTTGGKAPGASQVTALLEGEPRSHLTGQYQIGFEAQLTAPHFVKLVAHQVLTTDEHVQLKSWSGEDWNSFAKRLRK